MATQRLFRVTCDALPFCAATGATVSEAKLTRRSDNARGIRRMRIARVAYRRYGGGVGETKPVMRDLCQEHARQFDAIRADVIARYTKDGYEIVD